MPETTLEIPAPEGLEYRHYQREGIEFASAHDRTLNGDEMGTGKTIQAIGTINANPDIHDVLIICPASLRVNWARELDRWLVRHHLITVVQGSQAIPYETGFDPVSYHQSSTVNVHIINYDVLTRWKELTHGGTWDLLIADECQALKNAKAQRTKAVLGGKGQRRIPAKRALFLTGTPILNRPVELWTLMKYLDPQGMGRDWFKFVKRYCAGYKGKWGWDVSGASNLDELQTKLRDGIMVRRLKKDVLKELPPKRRQVIELPMDKWAKEVMQAEMASLELYEPELDELRARVEEAKITGNQDEHDEAVKALKAGKQVAFEAFSIVRHATALAKVPQVVAHIWDVLESENKVVIMAHHKDVIDAIRLEFEEPENEGFVTTLTGDTHMRDRQANIDMFQNDPKCRLFIGSIKAAGVGITLTAASHIIFAELDWTPGWMSQCEDRVHRLGQEDSVLIQHLVLEGSLDANMAHKLIKKQEVITNALDGADEKAFNVDYL